MTVLILAHRKIKDLMPTNVFSKIDFNFAFLDHSQSKILTTGSLIISSLAIAIYLWSLYFIFQASFGLREQEILIDKLDREVKLQDIQLSNLETTLAEDSAILNSMEKVSSMRYIKTSSEVSYK